MPSPKLQSRASEAHVVTKATLRAAAHLDVPNKVLARIVGLSEATISRMGSGAYTIARDQKPFELALMFLRLYRSLDAILGGDETAAQKWLISDNAALGTTPLAAIQSLDGLVNVVAYVDARRAVG